MLSNIEQVVATLDPKLAQEAKEQSLKLKRRQKLKQKLQNNTESCIQEAKQTLIKMITWSNQLNKQILECHKLGKTLSVAMTEATQCGICIKESIHTKLMTRLERLCLSYEYVTNTVKQFEFAMSEALRTRTEANCTSLAVLCASGQQRLKGTDSALTRSDTVLKQMVTKASSKVDTKKKKKKSLA